MATPHDPESSADPRLDLHFDGVPDPARGENRPCLSGVEPGIKDPLG